MRLISPFIIAFPVSGKGVLFSFFSIVDMTVIVACRVFVLGLCVLLSAASGVYGESSLVRAPRAAMTKVGIEQGAGTENLLSTGQEDAALAYTRSIESARKGDSEAQRQVAMLYLEGRGVERDREKGLFWLRKLGWKGGARDQLFLGKYLLSEPNVAQAGREEAFSWVLRSARNGSTEGRRLIASMYLAGKGEESDPVKGVYWLEKLAEEGDVEALKTLGWMAYDGETLHRDRQVAYTYFLQAARQGDNEARRKVSNMYFFGEGVERDYKKAFFWTKKIAESGDVIGQYNLALMYEKGNGTAQSGEDAVRWFREAGKQGHVEAQVSLAWRYSKGLDVSQDSSKAFEWYKMAADRGNPGAQYNLGRMLAKGDGVERDERRAFYWWKKAARHDFLLAQSRLGFCYANGIGVSKDLQQAYRWWKKAAGGGDETAKKNIFLFCKKHLEVCGNSSN